MAQYEAGFVKILQDKRYQDGGAFGNYREQEDGIKYFEETDGQGIRTGYWEYPSPDGRLLRTEFEAGPGIGFRITNSNHHATTPVAKPQTHFQPIPTPAHRSIPAPQRRLPVHNPSFIPTTPTPGPQNLFDYPSNLEFSRTNLGHRFKFTAL